MPSRANAALLARACVLLSTALVVAAPSGSGGSSTTNVHVTFGAVSECIAPPAGNCGDFSISTSDFDTSLAGFKAGSVTTSQFNYYGSWWATNVGTETAVAADFCSAGQPATATVSAFPGVSYSEGSSSWTMSYYCAPNHDAEDYCSIVGGSTPPLLESTFTTTYTQSIARADGTAAGALSTKSRADISMEVGVAVNGVVIFSPFTGISTVAPYDESLDTCNGHPANGKYHYHGFTPCLFGETVTATPTSHSKIYGWAFDGFPIYGPYGYTDANDASSALTRVTTGYTCTSSGAACTTDAQKAVTANWAYTSAGMLDGCNGRWTKTPEFPDGMYVYVLNIGESGAPTFPGVPYCVQSYDASVTSTSTTSSPPPPSSPPPTPSPSSPPPSTPSSVTNTSTTSSPPPPSSPPSTPSPLSPPPSTPSPSSPPSPPPPADVVKMAMTCEGTVEDYTEGSSNYTNIQAHVAGTAGVAASYVSLEVTAGSVKMDVSVQVPSGSSSSTISSTLSSTYTDATTTSGLLGVTVTSSPAVTVVYANGDDSDDGLSTGAIIGIVIGGIAALLMVVFFVIICMRKSGPAKVF